MPQSIPTGLTADHVLRALADLDAGAAHPFGPPTRYEVVHGGKRYAPKAVIGLACRYLLGDVLPPDRFSGGEAPGQANYVLRRLGFTVVAKSEEADDPGVLTGKDWTADEVALVVADYMEMLRKEVLGEPYSKAEHRAAVLPLLRGRSAGSVEFKHQNTSAVLVRLGLPYIAGYKPRSNYQALLAEAVEAFLIRHPAHLDQLADAPKLSPSKAPSAPPTFPGDLFEDPPEDVPLPAPGKPWVTRVGRRIDFAARDAADRKLGRLGEEFVVELERTRLRSEGRDDLARKVDWVAQSVGDGLGFDVLSFDSGSGEERLVEVKTTGLGKAFPFYVTATEVRCSDDVPDRFHLYRVFDFAADPRLYVLPGSLRATCRLDPTQFRAAAGPAGPE
jgi:hypothetical protein